MWTNRAAGQARLGYPGSFGARVIGARNRTRDRVFSERIGFFLVR